MIIAQSKSSDSIDIYKIGQLHRMEEIDGVAHHSFLVQMQTYFLKLLLNLVNMQRM